jgi:hypothetical protein
MTHEHLSDEQLSAHLDGAWPEAPSIASTESLEAEIAACDACRQRLRQLRGARDLLRLPVEPVPPSVRAAAVEAAVAEGVAESPSESSADGRRDRATGTGAAPPRRDMRPTRSPRVLVGAAAAVAVLVAAVGVSLGLAHSRGPTASSAVHAPVQEPTTSGSLSPTAASPSTGLVSLGSIASPQALGRRLAPLLAVPKATSGRAAAGTDENGNPDEFATGSTAQTDTGASTVPAVFSPCVAAAQRAWDPSATVTLVATATYRQTPALVVVLEPVNTVTTENGRLAVVVARSGCRVLARTTL